jgi:D-alanyl-D-alanine carboxypeptidase/D-alanyl-D-alanine-endopeptidase (penicillin-binding protein 4)
MNSFPSYRLLLPTFTFTPGWFKGLLLLLCLIGIFAAHPARAQDSILRLIKNGGYMIEDGSGQHQYRENELFIPASTLKILTSLVALEFLGPDYRFETHIFLDGKGNLYIKGYGDPLLTSETLLEIGNRLSQMGIRQLQSICLDDTAFDLRGETASEENSAKSYDAPNGALAVNFNTVSLMISEKGRISSSESQTPLLPLMREIGNGLAPGLHRLNINTLPSQPGKSSTLRYTGELFTAQLQGSGILIRNSWKIQLAPSHLQPILIHRSRANLGEIIQECLKYSNNFIANQLFLACGTHTYGLPATWEKSRKTFVKYAATPLGLTKGTLVMMEGAGLSRQNRISPAAFIQVLNRFKPFATLLSPRDTIPLKSGTLTGVYCFAGYFPKDEMLTPFVILLNQTENNRNQLLKELQLATLGSTE